MRRIISKNIGFLLFTILLSCEKNEVKSLPNPADSTVQSTTIDTLKIPEKQTPTEYSKFSAAWFEIEYPSNFKAENSLKSYTNSEGFDSAVFTAPDGKVQFYVFSPQWSGEPTDIKVMPGERIFETSEEEKNGNFVKRWTVKANDGTYSRSYEETSENVSHTNQVFGIKYSSDADLEKYRDEYLHFKNSLIQFAD